MKKSMTQLQPTAAPLCLSDYRLNPIMLVSEVCTVLEDLKAKLGRHRFYPIANEVYFNLNKIQPGALFCYQKYFTGERLEVFMVVAFRYIVDHMDYEFLDDYSAIRRLNQTSLFQLKNKQLKNKELQTNNNEL